MASARCGAFADVVAVLCVSWRHRRASSPTGESELRRILRRRGGIRRSSQTGCACFVAATGTSQLEFFDRLVKNYAGSPRRVLRDSTDSPDTAATLALLPHRSSSSSFSTTSGYVTAPLPGDSTRESQQSRHSGPQIDTLRIPLRWHMLPGARPTPVQCHQQRNGRTPPSPAGIP
jgi:hypothetical protein